MPPRADGSPFERATSHRFSANESRSASFGIGVDGRALQEDARSFSLNRQTGKNARQSPRFFPSRRWKTLGAEDIAASCFPRRVPTEWLDGGERPVNLGGSGHKSPRK